MFVTPKELKVEEEAELEAADDVAGVIDTPELDENAGVVALLVESDEEDEGGGISFPAVEGSKPRRALKVEGDVSALRWASYFFSNSLRIAVTEALEKVNLANVDNLAFKS